MVEKTRQHADQDFVLQAKTLPEKSIAITSGTDSASREAPGSRMVIVQSLGVVRMRRHHQYDVCTRFEGLEIVGSGRQSFTLSRGGSYVNSNGSTMIVAMSAIRFTVSSILVLSHSLNFYLFLSSLRIYRPAFS